MFAGRRSSSVIREAETRLAAEWGRMVDVWRDEVAARFASNFWLPLQQSIAQYHAAVEELEDALAAAEEVADR